MPRSLYVAILSREKWWIDLEGKAFGPFQSLNEAKEEGLQLARFAAHTGKVSELLIPDENGRYRVVWASDAEPHAGLDRKLGHAA